MKSPDELARRLTQQWEDNNLREERLIGASRWPIELSIGRPTPSTMASNWTSVAEHNRNWGLIEIGDVKWEFIRYRALTDATEIPVVWRLFNTRQWVEATGSECVQAEFNYLESLLSRSNPIFHPLFVRQRFLWKGKSLQEICKAAELAGILEPGCANGTPLRSVSFVGIDSKFIERNRGLILRLLDIRFDGEASRQGLEVFLNAWQELDHWLLVADMDGDLLPFRLQRVRGTDLSNLRVDVQNLLIVENERCLHQLPQKLPGTIAVLGVGNNLRWLASSWIQKVNVGYWGDIDTWGLALLAAARAMVPQLFPLLMTREIFEGHARTSAVVEAVVAGEVPPPTLSADERELYLHLLSCEKGRLEQEFLSRKVIGHYLSEWLNVEVCDVL